MTNPPRSRRRFDHAQIRLDAHRHPTPHVADLHGCSIRTVQRITAAGRSTLQPYIDLLATADNGEPLRGDWFRYLDRIEELGTELSDLSEPAWPHSTDRRALAAAGLAYWHNQQHLTTPDWLQPDNHRAPTIVAISPDAIDLTRPLTPKIVAAYNVASDAPSFHAI